jgi:mevalonate kinase
MTKKKNKGNKIKNDFAINFKHKIQAEEVEPRFIVITSTISKETTPKDILDEAKNILQERGKKYGDNYKKTGDILDNLLPDVKGDKTKLFLISQMVNKLTRYCKNIENGHKDSLIDLINYTAILASIDENKDG